MSANIYVGNLSYRTNEDTLRTLFEEFGEQFRGKIVLSPVVSVERRQCFQYTPPPEGSVALLVQKMLPYSAVVSALHTIPANRHGRFSRDKSADRVGWNGTNAKRM